MENNPILVFGGSGLVGSYLLSVLNPGDTSLYVSTHSTRPKVGNEIKIDLSSPTQVRMAIEKIKPSIIINLAAFTDVDGCERNKDHAIQLNAKLPGMISDSIKSSQSWFTYFLHISTDYVFDGEDGNYLEDSQPHPINWYGKTKLLGEKEIITKLNDCQWCIARTSTPFGIHPTKQSLPVYVLNRVSRGEPVQLVVDQYTSPIYSLDLARMLKEIITHRISGIIHTAGRSRLSRFEQGMEVAKEFELNTDLVRRCSATDMKWLAPRPRDSSLNVTKAMGLLRHRPRDYSEGIKDFISEVRN